MDMSMRSWLAVVLVALAMTVAPQLAQQRKGGDDVTGPYGKLLSSWGTFGQFPGGFWGPHQFSVDNENNLYIADVHVGRVQKFRPKPGVNPALLVGQRPPQTR
jgi:hypothetical protein